MKIMIEKVWSNNIFLPKASIIKTKLGKKYYPALLDNSNGKFTYRLKLSIIK